MTCHYILAVSAALWLLIFVEHRLWRRDRAEHRAWQVTYDAESVRRHNEFMAALDRAENARTK